NDRQSAAHERGGRGFSKILRVISRAESASLPEANSFSQTSSAQRKTLRAAGLGWGLDAFDVMLYVLVLAHISRELHMDKPTAGFLATLTLLASGLGGLIFGFIADRFGRRNALMLSILTYSVC